MADGNGNGNGAPTKKRRGPGRPWPRGTSGNPGGQPRSLAAVREACRALGPQAIAVLEEVMRSGEPGDRIRAASIVLDRGFGRPTAHLEVERKPLTARELPPREDWEAWAARVDEYVRSVTE